MTGRARRKAADRRRRSQTVDMRIMELEFAPWSPPVACVLHGDFADAFQNILAIRSGLNSAERLKPRNVRAWVVLASRLDARALKRDASSPYEAAIERTRTRPSVGVRIR